MYLLVITCINNLKHPVDRLSVKTEVSRKKTPAHQVYAESIRDKKKDKNEIAISGTHQKPIRVSVKIR